MEQNHTLRCHEFVHPICPSGIYIGAIHSPPVLLTPKLLTPKATPIVQRPDMETTFGTFSFGQDPLARGTPTKIHSFQQSWKWAGGVGRRLDRLKKDPLSTSMIGVVTEDVKRKGHVRCMRDEDGSLSHFHLSTSCNSFISLFSAGERKGWVSGHLSPLSHSIVSAHRGDLP